MVRRNGGGRDFRRQNDPSSLFPGVSAVLCAGPRRLFHGAARRPMRRARACDAVLKSACILTDHSTTGPPATIESTVVKDSRVESQTATVDRSAPGQTAAGGGGRFNQQRGAGDGDRECRGDRQGVNQLSGAKRCGRE